MLSGRSITNIISQHNSTTVHGGGGATFNRVNICANQKLKIDETDSRQPKVHRKIHTSLWILKISRKKSGNQKSQDFC
jgi:hypothetical protein